MRGPKAPTTDHQGYFDMRLSTPMFLTTCVIGCVSKEPATTAEEDVVAPVAAGATARDDEAAIPDAVPDACRSVPSSGDGAYCGFSTANGFDPDIVDAIVLVTCINHKTADTTVCRGRCVINNSGPDRCLPDPCTNVTAGNSGLYCGRSSQGGFNPADASNFFLYSCQGGKTVQTFFCAKGCTIADPGQDDFCNS